MGVQIGFIIDEELHEVIVKRANKLGVTKTHVLRWAIGRGIKEEGRLEPWQEQVKGEIQQAGALTEKQFKDGLWAWLDQMVRGFSARGMATRLTEASRTRSVFATETDTP
jgi:hypothetical protein